MEITKANNIFDYIVEQETSFEHKVKLSNAWMWGMKQHLEDSFNAKNGILASGKNEGTINEKPVKNIIPPVLEVRYRAEDVDQKDILLWIDGDKYDLSFLVKKYHDDKFIIENDMDTFWDTTKEEKIDMGGTLLMNVGKAKPLQMSLMDIAFCDQHNLLTSPIGFKYLYSPYELQEMGQNWGKQEYGADISIDELIELAKTQKGKDGKDLETDKVEVYLVLGYLPDKWFGEKSEKYSFRQWVGAFYQTKDGKQGKTLFQINTKNPLKLHKTNEVHNRALGRGGIEDLFEPYVWTNYSEIRKKEMLDNAVKVIHLTDDPTFSAKHPSGLADLEVNEVLEVGGTKGVWQLDTVPRNLQLFVQAENDWWSYAQTVGFAHDPMLGVEAKAGTPFRAQAVQIQQGTSTHEYRRGKFAKFIEEVYKDWILPYIAKQITKDQEWLSEIDLEDMQKIAEKVATRQWNRYVIDNTLADRAEELMTADKDSFIAQKKQEYMKSGNNKLIKILKDELKDVQLKVKVNVAGKQKNLGMMADAITNIWRFAIANPAGFQQVMQIPGAAKSFNQLLEISGFSPIQFDFTAQPAQIPQQMTQQIQQQPPAQMMPMVNQ